MNRVTAGADVDAYCTKCKMDLAHVVIAVAGTKIVRVECKTCHGVHAYRNKAASARAASSRRTTAPRAKKPTSFDSALAGRDLSRAKPYRANVQFAPDDIIDHKSFGLGLVLQALDDKKIEVIFREGPKILVHAR